ncbi:MULTISPECIES: carbohydrate ABC transporter permease [unclassified Rathayibacter]|uniref:carbohydrate ABC transporter permease n=1 Tax=unclassified Rathayibacter TaxID=2609250 RepID=UPI000FA10F8C|nr:MULTISPECIES: carbohydrate ABC transporter permease [unclassified Rathayibacter]ROP49106.1 multiple sugar transport system permease protein [Rathayibacter sp. PhB186]ROS50777.1 multiple sugar transport system permease protein [Rathayibacter sp. PhB185]
MTTTDQITSRTAPVATEPTLLSRAKRRRDSDDEGADRIGVGKRRKMLVAAGLTLFLLYSVAPVWWLVVNATKNQRDLITTSGLWFADFNLFENIEQIVTYQDGIFVRWTLNSILYAGVGSFAGMVVSLACGYGLARFEFRGKKLILGAVIAAFLVPYAMLTLPLYLLFSQVGLVDTVWSVLIPTAISPFSVYLSKVYVEGAIPPELLEAARIDGAGEFRIFVTIVVRMLGTGAATVFLLAFIASWNGFFLPLTMLQGSDKWTMTLGLYNWLVQSQANNSSGFDYTSLVITGALLSVIPLAAIMLAMQRFWKSGVSLGALK